MQSEPILNLEIPFKGFQVKSQVVFLYEANEKDNRIYEVSDNFGTYYTGRTNIEAKYGDQAFLVDSTKLRPATLLEQQAHCRMYSDEDVSLSVVWVD